MTIKNPPFEDVFPIEHGSHVSFQRQNLLLVLRGQTRASPSPNITKRLEDFLGEQGMKMIHQTWSNGLSGGFRKNTKLQRENKHFAAKHHHHVMFVNIMPWWEFSKPGTCRSFDFSRGSGSFVKFGDVSFFGFGGLTAKRWKNIPCLRYLWIRI